MASNYATDEDSRYVDKNSVVHYDGSPRLAEEYEERVVLGFQTLTSADRVGFAAKLKNALHGRAWTLCHRKTEISAQKLLDISKSTAEGQGPEAAVKLVVRTVRTACERVAPLLKTRPSRTFSSSVAGQLNQSKTSCSVERMSTGVCKHCHKAIQS